VEVDRGKGFGGKRVTLRRCVKGGKGITTQAARKGPSTLSLKKRRGGGKISNGRGVKKKAGGPS